MRSDTDGDGTSESETQKENLVKKKSERMPRPDVEEQSSDQDELIRKVQNTTLTGTVITDAAANHSL